MKKNDLQSRSIDVLRFLLIFYVVLIHSYTCTRGIVNTELYPGYRLVSFFFSLEIAQVAVPAFFFVSGYLFFFHKRPYGQKIRKEFHSLVIPYLVWNALILLMYFCLQSIPALQSFFSGENLPVRHYTPLDFLRAFWDGGDWDAGNGTPILHQFWYIRNLIVLGLLSPLIRWFVRLLGLWGVAALLAIWIFTPGQAFLTGSVSCFAAGAWFSLHGKDFVPAFRRIALPIYILYPVFVITNTAVAWYGYGGGMGAVAADRVGFLAGIVFTANLIVSLVDKYGRGRHSYAGLRRAGFFLFAFHDPLLTFVKRLLLKLIAPPGDASLVAIYFLAPAAVIALTFAVYHILVRYTPRLIHLLTGR